MLGPLLWWLPHPPSPLHRVLPPLSVPGVWPGVWHILMLARSRSREWSLDLTIGTGAGLSDLYNSLYDSLVTA